MRGWACKRAAVAALAACSMACLLLLAGCCAPSDAAIELEDIEWVLVTTSASATDFRAFDVTARFADGAVRGFSGVNNYTAKYELGSGRSLTLSSFSSTERAGTPAAMRAEEVYLALLRAVRSFRVTRAGALELLDADGSALLVFEKSEEVAEAAERLSAADSREQDDAAVDESGKAEVAEGAEDATTPQASRLSASSVAYAASLGGGSHRGELLYVIIGSEHASEADARETLEEALPLFGDMQSYFIVQHSDNLAGLTPGRWVIVEAYRNHPDERNLQLARRAFPEARVARATVSTGDPIPVYEDLVP